MSDFMKAVAKIQKELKAPKNQRNKFGNYNYRNQEDILEAVKPLLGDLVLTVNDEMVVMGTEHNTRVYVKSTATITDGTNSISNSAFAREAVEQKGMADAQLTGATSSYARKYALNGLFLIDDTKDADSDEVTAKTKGVDVPVKTAPPVKAPETKIDAATEQKEIADLKKKLEGVSNPTSGPTTTSKTETKPAAKKGWGANAKKVETKEEVPY